MSRNSEQVNSSADERRQPSPIDTIDKNDVLPFEWRDDNASLSLPTTFLSELRNDNRKHCERIKKVSTLTRAKLHNST